MSGVISEVFRDSILRKCGGEKWKKDYVATLFAMGNDELFNKAIEVHWPDDYDGCTTSDGQWTMDISMEILTERLRGIGFLKAQEEA